MPRLEPRAWAWGVLPVRLSLQLLELSLEKVPLVLTFAEKHVSGELD